jgi:hypothetical protein
MFNYQKGWYAGLLCYILSNLLLQLVSDSIWHAVDGLGVNTGRVLYNVASKYSI